MKKQRAPKFDPPNIIGKAKALTYDSETTGLSWRDDVICGHVVTWGEKPEETRYFPVRHTGGGNLDPEPVERWVNDLMRDAETRNIPLYAHNAKFDMHMCESGGIVLPRIVRCTQVAAALVDENARKYSLEDCAQRYGVPAKKGAMIYKYLAERFGGEPEKSQMGNFHRLAGDDPKTVEYAAGDGTSTHALARKLETIIELQGMGHAWQLEQRVTRTIVRMERLGVRVNKAAFGRLKKSVSAQLDDARDVLPEGLNSGFETSALVELFESNGVEFPRTDAGNPSFRKAFLQTTPLGQRVLELRELTKLMGTFIEGATERFLVNDGNGWRIHASANQTRSDDYGTVTRRFSYNSPNLQQVPKRNFRIGSVYRAIFVPDPGFLMASNDYSQIEPRLMAHYAHVARMIEGYSQDPPIDAHTITQTLLEDEAGVDLTFGNPHLKARDSAKTINLGIQYGMGYVKLADALNISATLSKRILDIWHSRIPEVRSFTKKAERLARARGWVKTILDGRRHFDDFRTCYKAANSVIQGSAAELLKLKLVEVDDLFREAGDKDAQLLFTIHDDIVWQYRNTKRGRELHEEAKRLMVTPTAFELLVPLTIDSGTGKNWAEASYGADALKKAA